MARLFSLADAGSVDDPEHGRFEPGPDGAFDFPDPLSDRLHRLRHRGRPAWETELERSDRRHGEELDRKRDPAMLYDAVGEFSGALKQFAGLAGAGASPDAAARIAELERQLAEALAASGSNDTDGGDGETAAEPQAKTPARGKSPAKQS